METETLDKLYLEWSQFTQAKTAREIMLAHQVHKLLQAIKPFADVVLNSSGPIPHNKLSLEDWRLLASTYTTESAEQPSGEK